MAATNQNPSLVYIQIPGAREAVPADGPAGFGQVLEAGPGPALAAQACAARGVPHLLRRVDKGLARSLNVALSLCSGEWICVAFSDQPLAPRLGERVAELTAGSKHCVHLLRPDGVRSLPLVVLRRAALAYGAVDERFPCARLALLHWVAEIFPSSPRRYAPCEGVAEHHCSWLPRGLPVMDHPLAEMFALWAEEKAQARAVGRDPYRSGGYDPRRFWEDNSMGYVKWETYQPDEPEIMEAVDAARPGRVLELGCGAGRNIRYFAGAEAYLGLDIAGNLLCRAQDRTEPNTLGLVCADAVLPPVRRGWFDFVFADSTLQHVEPDRMADCARELMAVSTRWICLIEFTDELSAAGGWFDQVHMFRHDYPRLFEGCDLVLRREVGYSVQPAKKELFLFRKGDGSRV